MWGDKEKLVDRGWESMEALLDKEMPVEEDRKKVWFWWILGIVIISFLLGIHYNLNDFQNAEDVKIETAHNDLETDSKAETLDPNNEIAASRNVEKGLKSETYGVEEMSHDPSLPIKLGNESNNIDKRLTDREADNRNQQSTNVLWNKEEPLTSSQNIRNGSASIFSKSYSTSGWRNGGANPFINTVESPSSLDEVGRTKNTSTPIDKRVRSELSILSVLLIHPLGFNRMFDFREIKSVPIYLGDRDQKSLSEHFMLGIHAGHIIGSNVNLFGGEMGYQHQIHEQWSLRLLGSYSQGTITSSQSNNGGIINTPSQDDELMNPELSAEPEGNQGLPEATQTISSTLFSTGVSLAALYHVTPVLDISGGLIGNYSWRPEINEMLTGVRVGVQPVPSFSQFNFGSTIGLDYRMAYSWSVGIAYEYYFKDLLPDEIETQTFVSDPSVNQNSRSRVNVSLRYRF